MNRNIKTAAKLAALAGAFALTGCAFVPDTVHPQYIPQANVQKIPGADKVAVDVVVKNEKKHKDEVSPSKNGYDMTTAWVHMSVAKDFKDAIITALDARGFEAGSNHGIVINVVIKKFFLKETNNFSGIVHNGSSRLVVDVLSRNRKVVLSKNIIVNNYVQKLSAWSSSGGRSSSVRGLLNATVDKLADDKKITDAILSVGSGGVTIPKAS